MSKPKGLRHRWKYPVAYTLSREQNPATCQCGARMWHVQRTKKKQATAWYYGTKTEDAIVEIGGKRLVNPSPIPPCTRKS